MYPDGSEYKRGTVIITGASRGIGREIALTFAEKTDFSLLLLARNEKTLSQVAEACRDKGASSVTHLSADLSNPEDIRSIADKAEISFLSGIINNAGLFNPKPLEETNREDIDRNLQLNLHAAFELNQQFIPMLKSQGRGFLFHIGSLAAYQGLHNAVAYSISKHALLGYVRSLRRSLKTSGIAVSIIHPGSTWSSSWEGSGVDPEKLIDSRDIATLLVTLSAFSPRSVAEEITVNPQGGNL